MLPRGRAAELGGRATDLGGCATDLGGPGPGRAIIARVAQRTLYGEGDKLVEADEVEAVLALVPYPIAALADWTVLIWRARDDEAREGSTWRSLRRIDVYSRTNWSREQTAYALAHELGHAHDIVFMTGRTRHAYLKARGLGWRTWPRWLHCAGPIEQRKTSRAGAEDFAEVFAWRWCPAPEFRSCVAPPPDAETLRELEPFLMPPGGD